MSVRAKFNVSFVDTPNKTIHLSPVYSGSKENEEFYAATPGGQIVLNILNESALAFFTPGEYYVDFTRAEESSSTPKTISQPSEPKTEG